jgi:hypothetical protein
MSCTQRTGAVAWFGRRAATPLSPDSTSAARIPTRYCFPCNERRLGCERRSRSDSIAFWLNRGPLRC